MTSSARSRAFFDLHDGRVPLLLLPNAWDAASAALIAASGAKAVATTSAGMAWALGWPDGDALPVEVHLGAIARIVRVCHVPVTADIEGGYSDDPVESAAFAVRVADAGAVGINIEDGGGDPARLAGKISAIKAAAPDLFINARTDVYLRELAAGEAAVAETLSRAALYREAGADGLFVPGVSEPDHMRRIAVDGGLPLNVMALPGMASVAELQALGVSRLSLGPAICLAGYAAARAAAARVLTSGSLEGAFSGGISYGEMNALFA